MIDPISDDALLEQLLYVAKTGSSLCREAAARIKAQAAELRRLRADRVGVVEECARVCDKEAIGRMKQSLGAKSARQVYAARDFESMAMEARQLANRIRALAQPAPKVEGETDARALHRMNREGPKP